MRKIIITGITYYNDICHKLSEYIDNLNVCYKFSTDIKDYNKKQPNDEFVYYIDTNVLITAHKNNAILYTKKINEYVNGILIDDFYNSDITALDIYDVNNISNKIFNEYELLFIFIDDSKNPHNKDIKKYEYEYFLERISNCKTLYFLNEDHNEITKVILKYLYGSEEEQNEIYEKYTW